MSASEKKRVYPKRRAAAEHNREKILTAARQAFAESDAPVSLAEICRRAGVTMPTLYRNFSGRPELLRELYLEEVADVCDAPGLHDGMTPGESLDAWLRRLFVFLSRKHRVVELLKQASDDAGPFLSRNANRVLATARPLLAAAQHSQEVREDLTIEQVMQMVLALATIPGDSDYLAPMLQTLLDGLKTRQQPPGPGF
jgi:AcrR family transcriptional regulator